MRTRRLGGLTVPAQGLGCMGMSEFYGTGDQPEAERTIQRALDLGVTFLDTADMYGPFTNERLVGQAIAGRRDEVVLATKFGNERRRGRLVPRHQRHARTTSARPATPRCSGSASTSSTSTTSTGWTRTVPIEDTWGALKELVDAGKIRHAGISEAAPETIRRAHAVQPVTAVQTEYSLWTRDPEDDGVLATCAELGIGFVAYSPHRPRASCPGRSAASTTSTRRTSAGTTRGSRARPSQQNLRAGRPGARDRRREGRDRHASWRWRG